MVSSASRSSEVDCAGRFRISRSIM
jgi:hypothetical protein